MVHSGHPMSMNPRTARVSVRPRSNNTAWLALLC